MKRASSPVIAFVLMFVAQTVAWAKKEQPMKTVRIDQFSFMSPEAEVKVGEVGVNAHDAAVMCPSNPSKKCAWITLYTMTREERSSVPEAARLSNFKTTYLGSAKPAEKHVERSFFGKAISGDWQRLPTRSLTLEAFEVPLPDGGALFVGLRRADEFPAERAEAFFARFAATLHADTGK